MFYYRETGDLDYSDIKSPFGVEGKIDHEIDSSAPQMGNFNFVRDLKKKYLFKSFYEDETLLNQHKSDNTPENRRSDTVLLSEKDW